MELQRTLDRLCKWAKFNVSKCYVMYIGHSNPKHQYRYSMNGSVLLPTVEERDIGVTVRGVRRGGARAPPPWVWRLPPPPPPKLREVLVH